MPATGAIAADRLRDRGTIRGVQPILSAVVFGAQKFLNHPDWSDLLEPWLQCLGESAGADQVRIFRNDETAAGEPVRSSLWAEWLAPGIVASPMEALQNISFEEVGCARWVEVLGSGGVVAGSADDLPESERPIIAREGNLAVAIVPVFTGARWWGFFGFADCAAARDWTEAEIAALSGAAGILGAALARREMEERIVTAQVQEQLAAEIGEVLAASGMGIDEILELCSARIIHHLHADLVRVWAVEPEGTRLRSASGASHLLDDRLELEVRMGEQAVGRIASSRRPETWQGGLPELWPGSSGRVDPVGLTAGAGLPLIIDGRLVGVVILLSREPVSDVTLGGLTSVTDELALAIEHSRATSALHRTEDRYRRLVEATIEGICIHDGRRVHDYNPALAAMLGLEPTPTRDYNPLDFVHPENRETARQHIATNYTRPYEVLMLRLDGSSFPAELKGRSYVYEGRTLRVTAIRDITERKEAERTASRLIEERRARELADRDRIDAQFLAEASRILASSFDTTTSLSQVAHLAVRSLAECCIVSLAQGGGEERVTAVSTSADREAGLEAALARADVVRGDALRRRQLEGRPFIISRRDDRGAADPDPELGAVLDALACTTLISVPITGGGEILGSIVFAAGDRRPPYDAHQLSIAEELGRRAAAALVSARSYYDARAATAARDEMLAVVAHDLRNPLNTIAMSSGLGLELLMAEPAGPQRRQFEIIKRTAEHMNRLIHDLLDATRMQSGQLALELTAVRVPALVEEAAELLEPLARDAGILFTTEVAGDLAQLRADRARVLQVLSNLIGNALKFTPRGGRVTLAVQPHPAGACFSVRDTGPGIAADQVPHIFGRFWQARRTDRRGLGLGLAIAKGIVDAHGGSIWVESEPGAGSSFLFTLPTADTG